MALVKAITKHGNSAGIILEQTIWKMVCWEVGTEIEIRVSGESIVLTPPAGRVRTMEEKTLFLNTPQECQWLRERFLKNIALDFKSFALIGNDYPTRVILYRDKNPRFDSRPLSIFNIAGLLTRLDN
jgi:antitoxin component of MazEF toxin-antitoxin module